MRPNRTILALASIGLGCVAVAWWLLPRALPTLALDQRMTRPLALQRADSFFRAHALAPQATRTAVRFQTNDSLLTFIELGGGGKDTLDVLVRTGDAPLFVWTVRAFAPGEPREATVHFAPDGRVIGFRRVLPDAEERPSVTEDSARTLAQTVLATWIDERPERWRIVATSYETRAASGRLDRTVTFERTDRRIGDAPIRLRVVIAGDTPAEVRVHVVIPQTFTRRYGEMRSANGMLELLAALGTLAIAAFGAITLRRFVPRSALRWRPAMVIGGVIGVLMTGTVLNTLPTSWYDYDTAMSPAVFQAGLIAIAVFAGAATFLLVALTLVAAEALTRHAFPLHLDWWQLWRERGTREVAASVGGGYVVAAFAFAYVAVFYVVSRELFGWWVPSALLDDPNQIATPLPWLAGMAASLQAAVWEEALFRALPLSALALWVGDRSTRRWWMAAGVVMTALIFGFAHAGYPSWPPYSRGVEIFLDACLWAVLFLRFGLLVTVLAHFAYNLVLFGLFAAAGSALPYRVTAVVTLLALLAPALAVAVRWMRQGGFVPLSPTARFAAWRSTPAAPREVVPVEVTAPPRAARGAWVAAGLVIAAVLFSVAVRAPRPLGAEFTADRARSIAVADSALRARKVSPEQWTRLATTATDPQGAWRRFLQRHGATERAAELARTYAVSAWWIVRYVHTQETLAERAEEWRVRVFPDGRLLDVRHVLPENAPGVSLAPDEARRVAAAVLLENGVDTSVLVESQFDEVVRPQRRDVTITYTDTTVDLPAGARARVWVTLAGDEPVTVRRGIELPEAVLRDDRRREQGRLAVVGATVLVALVLVSVAAVRMVRRQPAVMHDRIERRTVLALLLLLAALQLASGLLALPEVLAGYDTSVPWSRFRNQVMLGLVMSLLGVFVLAALWLGTNALRRRLAIPIVPAEGAEGAGGAGGRSRNALIAGLGLGGTALLLAKAVEVALRSTIPPAASTTLGRAIPILSPALEGPWTVALLIPVLAIPVMAIAGASRRSRVASPLGVALVAAFTAAMLALANLRGGANLEVALVVVLSAAAITMAVRTWGAVSVTGWLVGGLVVHAVTGLQLTAHAATRVERLGGALSFVVAVVLTRLVLWWTDRHATPATGEPPHEVERPPVLRT